MYIGNKLIQKLVIGGGYYTDSHKASGGWRIDFVQQDGLRRAIFDMEKYVLDADNGDGTRYAVHQILNRDGSATNLFKFSIHVKNVKKGTFKRGEDTMFDFIPGKFFHVHVKIGGYNSATKNYLKFLDHVDPTTDIRTNYTPDIYHGTNKGVEVPGTLPITPPQTARKMQTISYKFKTKVTVQEGLRLRSKPDDTSEKLALIPYNTEIEPTDIAVDADLVGGISVWIKLTFEGVTGWAWAGGIELPKAITFEVEKLEYEKKLSEAQKKYDTLDQANDNLSNTNNQLLKESVSLKAQAETQKAYIEEQKKQLTILNEKLAQWNSIKRFFVLIKQKLSNLLPKKS